MGVRGAKPPDKAARKKNVWGLTKKRYCQYLSLQFPRVWTEHPIFSSECGSVAWEEPLDESIQTWFLANASEKDRTLEAKFVCRSQAGCFDIRSAF